MNVCAFNQSVSFSFTICLSFTQQFCCVFSTFSSFLFRSQTMDWLCLVYGCVQMGGLRRLRSRLSMCLSFLCVFVCNELLLPLPSVVDGVTVDAIVCCSSLHRRKSLILSIIYCSSVCLYIKIAENYNWIVFNCKHIRHRIHTLAVSTFARPSARSIVIGVAYAIHSK